MTHLLAYIRTKRERGFTLIETLVAISLLVIAVAAPMTLAAQSLSVAFYARDQITAFHLGQEAIEAIRSRRDSNALNLLTGTPTDLFDGIPDLNGAPFTIDTRNDQMTLCSGTCGPIRNQASTGLYGYGSDSSWADTRYTRTLRVTQVGGTGNEVRVDVDVRWRSGPYQERVFTISNSLYRWVPDDATAEAPGGGGGGQTFAVTGQFTVPDYTSLTVQCWGGGGGGGGSGTGAAVGQSGESTTFLALAAGGGTGGVAGTGSGAGGSGGTASGGTTNSPGYGGSARTANAGGTGGNAP